MSALPRTPLFIALLGVAAAVPVWSLVYVLARNGLWPESVPAARHLWLPLVAAPILEEVVFRGAIQGYLLRRLRGRRSWGELTAANAITTTLFAAGHVFRSAHAAAGAIVPSLYYGWVRDRTGNITLCVFMHMLHNAGYVAALAAAA